MADSYEVEYRTSSCWSHDRACIYSPTLRRGSEDRGKGGIPPQNAAPKLTRLYSHWSLKGLLRTVT